VDARLIEDSGLESCPDELGGTLKGRCVERDVPEACTVEEEDVLEARLAEGDWTFEVCLSELGAALKARTVKLARWKLAWLKMVRSWKLASLRVSVMLGAPER